MKMIFLILIIATLNFFYLSEPTVANENMDKYFRSSGSDHRGGQVSNFSSPGLIDCQVVTVCLMVKLLFNRGFKNSFAFYAEFSNYSCLNLSFSYSSQGLKNLLAHFLAQTFISI